MVLEAARRYLINETLQALAPLSEEESRLAKEEDLLGLNEIHQSRGRVLLRAQRIDQIIRNTIQALGGDPSREEVFAGTPDRQVIEPSGSEIGDDAQDGGGASRQEPASSKSLVKTRSRGLSLRLASRQLVVFPMLFELGNDRLLKYPLTSSGSYEIFCSDVFVGKFDGIEGSRRSLVISAYLQQIKGTQVAIARKILACDGKETYAAHPGLLNELFSVRDQPEYSAVSNFDLAMIAARGTEGFKERDLEKLPLGRPAILDKLLGKIVSPESNDSGPLTLAEAFVIYRVLQEVPQEELLKFGIYIPKKDREVLEKEAERQNLTLGAEVVSPMLVESALKKVLAMPKDRKKLLIANSENHFAQLLLTYYALMDSEEGIKALFERFMNLRN